MFMRNTLYLRIICWNIHRNCDTVSSLLPIINKGKQLFVWLPSLVLGIVHNVWGQNPSQPQSTLMERCSSIPPWIELSLKEDFWLPSESMELAVYTVCLLLWEKYKNTVVINFFIVYFSWIETFKNVISKIQRKE